MAYEGFECIQCGHCCKNLCPNSATEEDYQTWENQERWEIIDYVSTCKVGDQVLFHDIWIDPETGDEVDECPFLDHHPDTNKYECIIHSVKPKVCRDYPTSKKHAIETGCKGKL